MIYLSTTQSSLVTTTTIQNRISLANNFYTWKINNRNSFEEYTFCPLVSTQSGYYNQFTFSIGTPIVVTGSTITLDLEIGEFHYEIYQTTTQYDLTLSTSLGIVENGILIVPGIGSTYSIFTASNIDTINVFNEL